MIVGLTGPNAAGKGEIAHWLAGRGYALHSLSDIVREAVRAEGHEIDRQRLIDTGQRLRREFGPGVLAERLLPRLEPRAAVDSVRSPAEVEVLRRLPAFRLLGVDAPVEIRWRRAVARAREGEVPDFATFVQMEGLENQARPDAQQLRRTLELADARVLNSGTIEDLVATVRPLVEAWERDLG